MQARAIVCLFLTTPFFVCRGDAGLKKIVEDALRHSREKLSTGVIALHKKLEEHKGMPDVLVDVIGDCIRDGRAQDLALLHDQLFVLRKDDCLFRALAHLPDEEVLELILENEVIKRWWSNAVGQEWTAFQNSRNKPVDQFIDDMKAFIKRHPTLSGRARSQLEDGIKLGTGVEPYAPVSFFKNEVLRKIGNEERFRFYLFIEESLEKELKAAQCDDLLTISAEKTSDCLWQRNLAHEKELHDFVERMNALRLNPDRAVKKSFFGDAPREVMADYRVWLFLVAVPVVVAAHSFFNLRRDEHFIVSGHGWMHWCPDISAHDLQNYSAQELLNLLAPEIFLRRKAANFFCSRAILVADFLDDLGQELVRLKKYQLRCARLQAWGLAGFCGVDAQALGRVDQAIERLVCIHKKITILVLETKIMRTAI